MSWFCYQEDWLPTLSLGPLYWDHPTGWIHHFVWWTWPRPEPEETWILNDWDNLFPTTLKKVEKKKLYICTTVKLYLPTSSRREISKVDVRPCRQHYWHVLTKYARNVSYMECVRSTSCAVLSPSRCTSRGPLRWSQATGSLRWHSGRMFTCKMAVYWGTHFETKPTQSAFLVVYPVLYLH